MPEDENLIEATKKAIRIRLVVIPVVCVLAAVSNLIPVMDVIYIFLVLALFTFFLYLTTIFKKGMLGIGYISATVEIAIVSWFLWYANIQFYFFFAIFIFIILAHTILESTRKGLYLATIVIVSYIALFITNKFVAGEEITFLSISSIIVNVISIYGVTFLAGRLADELKEANRKLQVSAERIIDNMSDGLIVFNEQGNIIRKNLAAEKVLIAGDWVLKAIQEGASKIEISPNRSFESKISLSESDKIVVLHDISPPCGVVLEKTSAKPLNLAVVRIYKADFNRLQETKVTDESGRFYFMPSVGEYYLSSEKEGYRPYKSQTFKITKEGVTLKFNIEMEKV